MADRSRALAPLGPDARSLAGRGNRDDARHGRRRPGARVLDVAAGAGGQTLAAARRVGPDGHVLATDISPQHPRLRRAQRARSRVAQRRDPSARRRAAGRRAGRVRRGHLARRLHLLPRPARRVRRHAARAQAGRPPGRDRLLDARSQRLLLDPGVDHPPPGAAAGAGAGPAGPVQPRRPRRDRGGARAGGLHRRRGAASRRPPAAAVRCRVRPLRARVLRGPAPDACGADEAEREEAWSEIERELSRYETADGFEGPCELLVVGATA